MYNSTSRRKSSRVRSFVSDTAKLFAAKRQAQPRKLNSSNLVLDQLVKKGISNEHSTYQPSKAFKDLNLHPALKENIRQKKYEYPTEIQDRTLEHLLAEKDLIGIAQTGTGKTAAFLIPILQHLLTRKQSFQTLVLVPTRELALQIEDEFNALNRGFGFKFATLIGGTSVSRDVKKLQQKQHLVIGTPGRIEDLAKQGALKLQEFSKLILDEFDRMLDIGFAPAVTRIIQAIPHRQQTILFSATLDPTQRNLINGILTSPVEIMVSSGKATGEHIDQDVIKITQNENKIQVLLDLLKRKEMQKTIVFAETKRTVKQVCIKLNRAGINAEALHGDKTQNHRIKTLEKFRQGRLNVLVATDVAARGLDIDDVTHVINYQVPRTFESYLHRIGRTGRAGKTGKALTFVD